MTAAPIITHRLGTGAPFAGTATGTAGSDEETFQLLLGKGVRTGKIPPQQLDRRVNDFVCMCFEGNGRGSGLFA